MSDDFSARYRLLKCVLVEDGTRTHNAQELASGRVVMVHITDAAGPEEVDGLRAQLALLPTPDRNKVLEAVTLPSGFAVVTEFLPAPLSFRSWLNAHAAANPESVPPAELGSATTTLLTVVDPSPEPSAGASTAPAPEPADPPSDAPSDAPSIEGALPSSFSQIFGKPLPPTAPVAVEYPAPFEAHHTLELPPSALADARVPLVGSDKLPAPPTRPVPAIADIVAPAPMAMPSAAAPGEFTQMFSKPAEPTPNPVPPVATFAPGFEPVFGAAAPPLTATPPVATPPVATPLVPPPLVMPPLSAIPSPPVSAPPLTAASSFGYDNEQPPTPPTRKPPGEFTMMFGAPETAAPMPETMRPSPMREAPPPAFSPLTPERRLESPPVEPLHRVVTNNPNYVAGIHQDGVSPIAPNIVGGGQFFGPPQRMPDVPIPVAHASPLVANERGRAGDPASPAQPGILPPPIFSSGTSTPLSALGGAAPLVNASAGPSDFTRLISSAAEPVLPPLAPTASATGRRGEPSNKRRMPTGLVFVINAVLLIATLLVFFVLRRPVPTLQQVRPARPVLPSMPTAPKLPTTP